jgi:protein-tyrosine phosphatase
MSEIIKNKLFLGDIFDANNPSFLKQNNITTIISVAADACIKNDNKDINVYKYKLNDDYECDISQYFDQITQLIYHKNIVLVNCMAGISRSATIVLVYLMRYYEVNLKEAFKYVRSKRSQICPNKKFLEYLMQEEKKLFGYNSLTYKEFIDLFFYT